MTTVAEKVSARLDPHEQPLEYCTYCPKMCRLSCPVAAATGNESDIPWALMSLANHARKGQIALTPEVARGFYDCTGCLLCQKYCLHGNDVPSAMRAARAAAVETGNAPPEVVSAAERFRRNGSMFPGSDREALAASLPADTIDPASRSALLVSCLLAGAGKGARDAAEALARTGQACALPDASLRCCGAPLLDLGYEREFAEVARSNAAALAPFERVVCDTSVCARTLEREYPRVGARFHTRVEDLVSRLYLALENGELDGIRKSPRRAIYHDPCHLGRHAGNYDPPRRLAAALFERPVGEFAWSRERASCCGGSGGYPFVDPANASRLAAARAEEAREAGYEIIVTASEECGAMLAGAGVPIPVRTLASLVAEALRGRA
jgi:Fe-S oxidoreductase